MDAWIKDSLEEMGRELGRLRRGTRETQFEWEVERLCDRAWWLLAAQRPTAARLVVDRWSVDNALREAERETRTLNRTLGYL